MRVRFLFVSVVLFLMASEAARAGLSVSIAPESSSLGLVERNATQTLSLTVSLNCTTGAFSDQVTFQVSSMSTVIGPSFTLSGSSPSKALPFTIKFPSQLGWFIGSFVVEEVSHEPGDSPCAGEGPPLSAIHTYVGTVFDCNVCIHDLVRIEHDASRVSPYIFSNITGNLCGPESCPCGIGICPVVYPAHYENAPGSTASPVKWTWKVGLYHRSGVYQLGSLQIALGGEELVVPTPFPLPPNNEWLRDKNGNIVAKVEVDVLNSRGFIAHAEQIVGIQAPPDRPFLSSDRSQGTSVELTYGAAGASSYRIYYGSVSGSYGGTGATQGSSPINAGAAKTFTVSGLRFFRPYYFAVKGLNAQGESVFSNEVDLNIFKIFRWTFSDFQALHFEPGCFSSPPNLVLWLPFDEATGTIAASFAGGSPGTFVGHPASSPGQVSLARCFDGTADYVEVPSHPRLDFGVGDFSIVAWVKRSAGDSGVRVIVDKRDETASFDRVVGASFFLLDGSLWFQLADESYSNFNSKVKVPIDDQWHHVAVTVLRNSPTGGQFYLDGQAVGEVFDPTGHKGSLNAVHPLRVGSRSSSVSALFKGCLDEVEIFSRSLSAGEILDLYNAQHGGICK